APTVFAGLPQTLSTSVAQLQGYAIDDGLPPGSVLTYAWSQISGPGTVVFANPTSPATTASFSALGEYFVRLSASDGALTGAADVFLNITAPGTNQPPAVNAGADQTIQLPQQARLQATATDDGLPGGSRLTNTWSRVSGPGPVTIVYTSEDRTAVT